MLYNQQLGKINLTTNKEWTDRRTNIQQNFELGGGVACVTKWCNLCITTCNNSITSCVQVRYFFFYIFLVNFYLTAALLPLKI